MQPQQPTSKKGLIRGLIRTLEWLIGMVLVILTVVGFVRTNRPKISADVSGYLRSNDPMGTVFSLSNVGSVPVYDLKVGCEIMRIDEVPPGNRHFVGPTTVYLPESRAEILSPGNKMTVQCGRAIAAKLDNVETHEIHAEMFLVVTFRPKGLWWHKSQEFPMGTEKTENGTWIWKSIPKD
jgi:hypothetical protein